MNTSADVKAETDVCCTSGNAKHVVESLGVDKVIFLPDEYLAKNIAAQTDVKIISSSEGLFWKMGKDRTRHEKVITTWLGKRGGAGKMPPRGFPKPLKFN